MLALNRPLSCRAFLPSGWWSSSTPKCMRMSHVIQQLHTRHKENCECPIRFYCRRIKIEVIQFYHVILSINIIRICEYFKYLIQQSADSFKYIHNLYIKCDAFITIPSLLLWGLQNFLCQVNLESIYVVPMTFSDFYYYFIRIPRAEAFLSEMYEQKNMFSDVY